MMIEWASAMIFSFGSIGCVQHPQPPLVEQSARPPPRRKRIVPTPKPRPVVQQAEEIKRQRLILPPLEYDHDYQGEVRVVRTPEEFRNFFVCRMQTHTPLGCARVNGRDGVCTVFIAPDDVLARYGDTYSDVLRHEIGHCNGWANHEGIRPSGSPPGSPPRQAKAPPS
jgi:hypothetical protein